MIKKLLLTLLFLGLAVSLSYAQTELDYMEYPTDAVAQAEYVTDGTYSSDLVPDMTSHTAPSGEVSASDKTSTYYAWKSFDDDTGTFWSVNGVPQWIQYQFTSAKIIQRYTIQARADYGNSAPEDWTFLGSNNGTDWDTLDTVTGEVNWANGEKRTYSFSNSTPYTYYRLNVTAIWNETALQIAELEMMEFSLQCYSESTIKQQGSYSLKGIAIATDSLNDTLTRTVDPTIDLSGLDNWKLYIYSNRTGSNVKIGIHDSGGTTTEVTPNVTNADTWQLANTSINGVADADKDMIDSIIVTQVNADSATTYYLDDMEGTTARRVMITN